MKKDAALKWAEDYTTYMARLTDVDLLPPTAHVNWENCVGVNDEVAEDGRYSLFYYIYSPAPTSEHTRVVRKLRHELPQHGYKVLGYRQFKNSYESATLQMRNVENSYLITAHTVGSGQTGPQRLSFGVRTPCMLPPGVEQQQM
ncbi:hypothetical protein [Streptomyces sp. TR06-5]|uniref:hypothetical protein n=1 Tax=unclassified Streptomyces TaxID=2593676 RepID=UPI0039A390CF